DVGSSDLRERGRGRGPRRRRGRAWGRTSSENSYGGRRCEGDRKADDPSGPGGRTPTHLFRVDGEFDVGKAVEQYLDADGRDEFGDALGGVGAGVFAVGGGQERAVGVHVLGFGATHVGVAIGGTVAEHDQVARSQESATQYHVLHGIAARVDLGGRIFPQHLGQGIAHVTARTGEGGREAVG